MLDGDLPIMAYSDYKSIGAVVKAFQINYTEADLIHELSFEISDYFRKDLATVMQEGVVDNSEFAICENLIYPILKEIWKKYSSKFILWSHQALNFDNILSGFPEYILARRSPLGKVVFDQPYLLLVEAKQDKFQEGWGQCLAEMIAAQRINENSDIAIFGIVTNGKVWEFGKLELNTFTKNILPYTIYDLERLFAAVNFIFQQCERQLEKLLV